MEVIFHREAKAELKEAAAYYEAKVEGLGKEFLEEVQQAVARISTKPRLHPPILEEVRRVNLRRFPFAIIFEPTRNHIRVLAVMHAHRRPWYWLDRK